MSHSRSRRGTGAAALVGIVFSLVGSLLTPAGSHAVTPDVGSAATTSVYYLDAEGDDNGDGRSPQSAWRTLDKVSATTFTPGDRILLQSGDSWTGQLWPKGSGTEAAPIEVGRYGEGAKPAIRGAGEVNDAVRLFNQQHWVIRDLDISNQRVGGASEADNLADLRGIHVSGDNSASLSGFVIDGVDVHDVTGEVNWISGSVANNEPGINFKTGWDGSKKTGGIVFDTTVPDVLNPPSTATILNDILIQNSSVINTSFAAITIKQYTGDGRDAQGNLIAAGTGWGTRTSPTDPKFAPHTDVTVRGNYIRQDGSDYACNGIYIQTSAAA
ncbi:hypothetical protein ACIQH5_03090 [Paenarthrobacter sp. NPDC091711]|uniref:hypothetical protein n=1 Tax=Paenarthrobacter sp. NPDC091711 TaxID=3364385 RepID=UPI0037F7237C